MCLCCREDQKIILVDGLVVFLGNSCEYARYLMKKMTIIDGIIALIALLGIVAGVAFVRRKCAKKERLQNFEANKGSVNTLDAVYDTLLETDLEHRAPIVEKTKEVKVKLKNKTYWSVKGSLIISSIVIAVFAIVIAVVSIAGQRAYKSRKDIEEQKNISDQLIIVDEQRNYESKQVKEINSRLDSIDAHIKTLRPSKPVVSKKKTK